MNKSLLIRLNLLLNSNLEAKVRDDPLLAPRLIGIVFKKIVCGLPSFFLPAEFLTYDALIEPQVLIFTSLF